MKRILVALVISTGVCASSAAIAQSFKMKNGKYEITTPEGEKVTIGKDGKLKTKAGKQVPKEAAPESELTLGSTSAKEPRTKGEAASCTATADLMVEHKVISDVPVAVSMTGTCDGDVFNTWIDASKQGITVAGTGELRLTESVVQGKEIAINVTGSGDVVIENAQIAGPIAINVSGTGDVVAKNSKIFGKIVVTGTGKFVDEGGNELVADHTKAVVEPAEGAQNKKKKSTKK